MANQQTKVEANLDGLEKLMKLLKDDSYIRIGIIGASAGAQHDKESGLTNALLGTYHEFGGTSKNGKPQPPQRSFLWMPLRDHLKFDDSSMKDLKKILWKQFFIKKSADAFWQTLLTRALETIEEAFDTEGWGAWKILTYKTHKMIDKKKGLKEGTQKHENYWLGKITWQTDADGIETGYEWQPGRQILTDTGKLRRSITGKIMRGK